MPSKIRLDLRFRVIPPTHQIFMVFPGTGYSLYDIFATRSHIFPELPSLELRPGKVISEQPDLTARIARSRKIKAWYASRKMSEAPQRPLSFYRDSSETKIISQTKGVLAGYFERAKKGDLVIIPPHNIYDKVLIGELLGRPSEFSEIVLEDIWDEEKVPARRVRWLPSVPKGELSLDLQRRLPSPNAFRLLDREAYAEIYSIAYGSYTIDDSYTSRFDVTESDFSTIDDYYIQQIFNSVAALCQYYDSDAKNSAISPESGWDEIISLLSDNQYIPDLRVSINSPGSLTLSCCKSVPLVVAALLALAALGSEATWKAAKAGTISIENSFAPRHDPCTARVANETLEQINMMGYSRWKSLCQKSETIRSKTGLKEQSKATAE